MDGSHRASEETQSARKSFLLAFSHAAYLSLMLLGLFPVPDNQPISYLMPILIGLMISVLVVREALYALRIWVNPLEAHRTLRARATMAALATFAVDRVVAFE